MNDIVERSAKERKAFRDENHACPVCGGGELFICGGVGSYWIEHNCGAYSQLCETLPEALQSDWVFAESTNMYPPIGG